MTEGVEKDVCGIGLRVTFIPPNAATHTQGQAFLVGGPIGNVHGVQPDPTADQPLPSNVAPARDGTTVTVSGKRFTVVSVDVAHARVRIEALC
jgi:hypothetical protein